MSCPCQSRWWSVSSLVVISIAALTSLLVYKYVRTQPRNVMIYSFLGAPGSGKGTLAEQCVQKLGFVMLSTGNLIREHIQNKTELGRKLQEYTQAGKLAPDDIVTSMVKEWIISHANLKKPIILDGFPRTAEQAQLLLNMINHDFKDHRLCILELKVQDEEVVRRIASRLVCCNKQCQSVYNVRQFTHVEKPVCKNCGAELVKRDDDKEEIVRQRLAVYAKTSSELHNFYMNKGIIVSHIDANSQSPEQVFETFKSML